MSKLLKLAIAAAILAIVCINPLNAAFIVKKEAKTATTASASSATTVTTTAVNAVTEKQAKKELKGYFKGTGKKGGYGGGKSKIVAALLAFFLGTLGIHSFYMGQTAKGFMQLGATILGIVLFVVGIAGYTSGTGASFPVLALIGYLLILGVSIWALVDFIRILTGGLEPEEGFDS